MSGIASGSGMNGMQGAGLALSNFADALAMMQNRPHGYAANNLQALQNLQRQMLMTQQIKKQQAQDSAVAGIAGGYDPTTGITWNSGQQNPGLATTQQVMTDPGQAGIAAQPATPGGQDGAPAVPPVPPTFTAQPVDAATQAARAGTYNQDSMDTLKRAFPDEFAKATMASAMAPPTFQALGKEGGVLLDRQGNVIKTIVGQDAGTEKLVNLLDTQNPSAAPKAYSAKSAAALTNASPGRYAVAPDYKPGGDPADKEVYGEPQTVTDPATGKQTLVRFGNKGSQQPVSGYGPKATGQDLYSQMPQGLTGEDAYKWVEQNVPGGTEVAGIARKVASGQMLQPSMSRAGSVGEKVNGLLGIAEPGYSQQDIKARYQLNQELTNQNDKALGGKLNSVSKIVNHSVGLLGSAYDLDNGSFTPLNALVNLGKSATSNEALASFKKNQDGLGNEFEKYSGGGVAGQQARMESAGSYSSNAGMPATIGSVGKTIEMMEGQLDPMVANYNRVYGKQLDTDTFIRTVMNQPTIADKLQGMKGLVDGYRQTGKVDVSALAALTGRKVAGAQNAVAAPTPAAAVPAASVPLATPGTLLGKTPDGRDVIAGPDGKPHVRGQ